MQYGTENDKLRASRQKTLHKQEKAAPMIIIAFFKLKIIFFFVNVSFCIDCAQIFFCELTFPIKKKVFVQLYGLKNEDCNQSILSQLRFF